MDARKPQQAVMKKTQTYYTYSLLWLAANDALDAGLASKTGGGFHFLSSIVLRAFSFEAFINTTAVSLVADFEEFEHRKTHVKIEEVYKLLKVSFPGGLNHRPEQTLARAFQFRNSMAHGRTETIQPEPKAIALTETMGKQLERRLTARWEPFISDSKFAERAKKDIEQIIRTLHEARPKPTEGLFELGGGSGHIDFRNADLEKLAEWQRQQSLKGKIDKT